MARIRSSSIRGELGRYEFEIHYSAKEKMFEVKKYPDSMSDFCSEHKTIYANTEQELENKFHKVVQEYEKTIDNWKLYIMYKFETENINDTGISKHGWSNWRKKLCVDFQLVYYNKVENKEYYITKEDWDEAEENGYTKRPLLATGAYVTEGVNSAYGSRKILHTPQLEDFFNQLDSGIGLLIEKIEVVFKNPSTMILMANNSQKLLS